jgi:hypothetical protein
VLSVACAGGLLHGSQGLPLAGTRGDGDQVGSLATGGDGGEQAAGHAVEPAKPDEAGARWAVDPQPVRPAAIPSCGAQHDPGDTAMPFVKGEDQPRQFRGWVIGPGPPAAVKQGGTGSVRLQEHPWPATGCRADRRLVSGHSRNLFGNDGHLRQLA